MFIQVNSLASISREPYLLPEALITTFLLLSLPGGTSRCSPSLSINAKNLIVCWMVSRRSRLLSNGIRLH